MGKALTYNDTFEKKKHIFAKKKALKSAFSIFWLKKSIDDEKKAQKSTCAF